MAVRPIEEHPCALRGKIKLLPVSEGTPCSKVTVPKHRTSSTELMNKEGVASEININIILSLSN